MQFRISTMLLVVTLIAVCGAWWVDHQRREAEATQLAAELYRVQTWLRYRAAFSQGALFHLETKAILLGTGDVLDINTSAGRAEMVRRMAESDTNFRVKIGTGKILDRQILDQVDSSSSRVQQFPGHFLIELYTQP